MEIGRKFDIIHFQMFVVSFLRIIFFCLSLWYYQAFVTSLIVSGRHAVILKYNAVIEQTICFMRKLRN